MKAEKQAVLAAFAAFEQSLEDKSFGVAAWDGVKQFIREKPEVAAEMIADYVALSVIMEHAYLYVEGEQGSDGIVNRMERSAKALGEFHKRRSSYGPLGYSYMHLLHEWVTARIKTSENGRQQSESDMRRSILNHFGSLFPDLEFVKIEKKVSRGRVDIFARQIADKRPVLFELKATSKNPGGQLLEYALDFDNPRLIAISGRAVDITVVLPNIEYYRYENGRLIPVANGLRVVRGGLQ